jgi:hypothetical protein
MILAGENRRTRRKTCPSATLSTTNPTWIDPGANSGLHSEKPATNRLSHGTAAWLKYLTYHLVPVLAPNYKQHSLSPAEVRKVCCSSTERYVRCVYMNLFGWRGARGLWNICKGPQAIKFREPLVYLLRNRRKIKLQ